MENSCKLATSFSGVSEPVVAHAFLADHTRACRTFRSTVLPEVRALRRLCFSRKDSCADTALLIFFSDFLSYILKGRSVQIFVLLCCVFFLKFFPERKPRVLYSSDASPLRIRSFENFLHYFKGNLVS